MPPSHLSTIHHEVSRLNSTVTRSNHLMIWTVIERFSGTRKQLKANMQYDKKSLLKKRSRALLEWSWISFGDKHTWQGLHQQLDETRAKYCILGANPFKTRQGDFRKVLTTLDDCEQTIHPHRKNNLFPSYPQAVYESSSWLLVYAFHLAILISEPLLRSTFSCSALWAPSRVHRHKQCAKRQNKTERIFVPCHATGRRRKQFVDQVELDSASQDDSCGIPDGRG